MFVSSHTLKEDEILLVRLDGAIPKKVSVP